ncbi:MAG: hypothetical protein C4296_00785 [Gemmataceae bacterium]
MVMVTASSLAGCSTAPIADLLDWWRPSHADTGRLPATVLPPVPAAPAGLAVPGTKTLPEPPPPEPPVGWR